MSRGRRQQKTGEEKEEAEGIRKQKAREGRNRQQQQARGTRQKQKEAGPGGAQGAGEDKGRFWQEVESGRKNAGGALS